MGFAMIQASVPDVILPIMAVSVQVAARIYGLGQSTVWQAIRAGKLPAHRVGRRVLLRLTDLETWIDSGSKHTALPK